ncbi:hypothetical protein [Streptomyces sp. NPDC058872]|uniref:hypothetical protein n=1 Tax=Streptomyces sp. NPDC058872 TaxID=3346661 RepID=UPI0036956D0E
MGQVIGRTWGTKGIAPVVRRTGNRFSVNAMSAISKRSLPHTRRAGNQNELAAETRKFFHRRQRQPHIVRGYFGGPHVSYVLDENAMSF